MWSHLEIVRIEILPYHLFAIKMIFFNNIFVRNAETFNLNSNVWCLPEKMKSVLLSQRSLLFIVSLILNHCENNLFLTIHHSILRVVVFWQETSMSNYCYRSYWFTVNQPCFEVQVETVWSTFFELFFSNNSTITSKSNSWNRLQVST